MKCLKCNLVSPSESRYCGGCGFELIKKKSIVDYVIKSNYNNKKIIKIASFVALFSFSYFLVQHFFIKNSSYDKLMIGVANEINSSCPIMIDSDTRLDNSVALPDKVFQYNYTLVNIEKEKIDSQEMKNFLEPRIKNFVKTSPQMKAQRDLKTTINYSYSDKKGVFAFLISVTPEMY